MCTNYYWYEKQSCSCCNRPYKRLYIGKSSDGWTFSLHVIPEKTINDLQDWIDLWASSGSYIEDEYGTEINILQMYRIITERYIIRDSKNIWSLQKFLDNNAEQGPNGLIRHIIDKNYCVKHGAGTWDCIVGEFC